MTYVYLLCSLSHPAQRYIGRTNDLHRRLAEHDAGKNRHTAKFRPWAVTVFIAFENAQRAVAFERYLKSGSGHAFANRHLW